jgi:hypothetical protein
MKHLKKNKMKQVIKNEELLRLFYEFVGEFEENLRDDYEKIPQADQYKFTYVQFCIIAFSNIIN